MKILIGMETSGALRQRFQALGHDVISIDLLPAEDGEVEHHWQGDLFTVFDFLKKDGWTPDVGVFHPTCTYLTNSAAWAFNDPDYDRYPGVGYHQRVKPGTPVGQARRDARELALIDVARIMDMSIPKIVIENPVGAISNQIRKPDQIIQPYQFGDDASKATCLWLKGVQPLVIDPAKRVKGRMVPRAKAMGASDLKRGNVGPTHIERWSNQTDTGQNRLSPGADRWKERSRTYGGIADAIVQACLV